MMQAITFLLTVASLSLFAGFGFAAGFAMYGYLTGWKLVTVNIQTPSDH